MARDPTTYWDYIKVEELLSLQTGIAESDADLSNEEVLFIVIHQIDELWFKLALRELVSTRDHFARDHVPEETMAAAVRGLRRATKLFEQIAGHFSLMETMTTRDYLGFRDKLSPASGFQSAQMREIEIVMGLPESDRIPLGSEGYLQALRYPDGRESPASRRVAARLADPVTLRDAIEAWLYRTPIEGSRPGDDDDAHVVDGFIERFCAAQADEIDGVRGRAMEDALTETDRARLADRYDREKSSARAFLRAETGPDDALDDATRSRRRRIRAAILFIESYRELPLLTWPRELLDAIVALEQAFVVFRQRHARMVERIIGRRTGTGGSAGVEYLDQTALRYRVFRDIWAVRTLLLRRDALPALEHAELYAFAEPSRGPDAPG